MKKFSIKLKNWLEYSNLKGNYHFIVIQIILIFIFLKTFSILSVLLFILLFVYIFIKHKPLCVLSLIICFLMFFIYLFKVVIYNLAKDEINTNLIVIEVENENNYQKVLFKNHFYKYIYYNKENIKFKVGQVYKVSGKIIKGNKERMPNGFNYQEYLENNYIVGSLEIIDINYRYRIIIPNNLNDIISKYYDNNFKYSGFLKALVIGTKNDLEENLKENIRIIGISHLFVVSGLHIGIIVSFFEKILNVIKLKQEKKKYVIIPFLILYLVITKFSVSVLRVTLSYLLKEFFKNEYSPLDRMSINIIIVLLLNPFFIYTYSFILTYLISTMIVIISPLLPKKVNGSFLKKILIYILNTIIISFFSIVITLPIVIKINNELNILSIIYNVIYIPLVSYLILPGAIIVSFFPFLEFFLNIIISFFITSINFLSSFSLFSFSLPLLSIELTFIYYLILIFIVIMVENKKLYFSFIYIIFMFFWFCLPYFNINDRIVFLDVAEGDSTHISLAFNSLNIIIDTGVDEDDEIVSYLKKQGIRKIDLIVISHGDNDHNGNLEKLLKNFKVKLVVLSCYDKVTLEILEENNFNKYYQVNRGDEFRIKDVYFKILWPNKNMNDINNNSLVFIMEYDKNRFLFTGDIEEKAENELIKLEKKIEIDILKIAHHGSNTSTKNNFLENVKFDLAVAMCGSKNTFGFPNKYTKERLKKYTVYYTSECYTITFHKPFYKKRFRIKYLNDN